MPFCPSSPKPPPTKNLRALCSKCSLPSRSPNFPTATSADPPREPSGRAPALFQNAKSQTKDSLSGIALCASTARMQTDTKLGMAESRVFARREAHVAGEDELAADAAGAAPDFCDANNRRLREPHERIHQNRRARSADSRHDV